jgi:hypothetical protein
MAAAGEVAASNNAAPAAAIQRMGAFTSVSPPAGYP